MKKLLSLLSVLTISGTAVPTAIATSPYQKEEIKNSDINYLETNNLESLNRKKRAISDCEGEFFGSTIYCSFSPELWEEITILMNKNWRGYYRDSVTVQKVTGLISNKINEFNVKGSYGFELFNTIFFSFDTLDNEWQKSDKKHHIRILYKKSSCNGVWSTCSSRTTYFKSVNIRDDWSIENNKYMSRLENDLKIFNLQIINDEKDTTILDAIKNKNPYLDISQFEIVNKEKYSYFSKGFSVKIKVKNGSEKYSNGIVKNNFIFNTKLNIDEINKTIQNDSKAKTWIKHLIDWTNDVQNEVKTSVPKKTFDEKIEWKNRKKEDLKTYIRDWSYVLNLIEHELKLEELNNAIQSVKNDINILKDTVKKLEEIIISFANSSNWNLANISTILAGISPAIPGVGTFASYFFTVVAGLSAIASI